MERTISENSDYDSALEWPGVDSSWDSEAQNANANIASLRGRTCLRLVVKSSAVLPRRRKVAVLDAYDEVQIGRDASSSEVTPRIRLKDMEVSKLHATLFWDREREEWAVVDMGSKHGTFATLGTGFSSTSSFRAPRASGSASANAPAAPFVRLSPSRQASMPRPLHHSDELTIGRTVFVVHVHPGGTPCDDCASEGEADIPLFSSSSEQRTQKTINTATETPSSSTAHDPKKAISLLKRSLMSRHVSDRSKPSDASPGPSQTYVDRSAKRRALHPYSRSGSPLGVSLRPAAASTQSLPAATPGPWTASPPGVPPDRRTASTPSVHRESAAPISDTNIGHRLLAGQGWAPGSALGLAARSHGAVDEETPGDSRTSLVEPLQVVANVGRRGLGMRDESAGSASGSRATASTKGDEDWREESRRRRWDEVRKSVM